jgi:hypothetical protein
MSDANVEIDNSEIVDALSRQIGGMSKELAILSTVVEAQKKEIGRLRSLQIEASENISQ